MQNICKKEGHVARSCVFSWLRGQPVQPMATDEARVVDVEGLVSPLHQAQTPANPEIIPPPCSIPITPETGPKEQTEPMTCTPKILIARTPLTDLEIQNKFEVLTDETTETEEQKDVSEPSKPPSTLSASHAVPPSPSILPQRIPPYGTV